MASFSERYGHTSPRAIQYESIDSSLKNRIWNVFYKKQLSTYDTLNISMGLGVVLSDVEKIMDKLGLSYFNPEGRNGSNTNIELLRKYLFDSNKWYLMYDFIEKYLELLSRDEKKAVISEYNKILEEEVSGYRIVNGLVAPIINENELQAIAEATKTPYVVVNTHLNKALSLFADRKTPDYENSIKESISAVEALCKIIVGDDKASLGQALKKLESNGIKLHNAFRSALDSLYGYTSDENGIRHAGVDFKNALSEDALFMLVSCSAFVNYLIEKWEKNNTQKRR